jgi:two-component system, sensor histidine kinase PdtaS
MKPSKSAQRPKTILIVEDEAVIAMGQSAVIKRFGFDAVTALDGESAIRRATETGDIDLVLMDINLGSGMDGTEAARRILAKRNLPIVFLTSHSEREMVERVRGITRYGYVIKNSGDFVLQSSIEMAFELYEAQKRVSESEFRQRNLLRSIPDLIWLKDENGVFLSCNHEFERFFGAPEADIVGKTDYDFMPPERADASREYDRKAMAAGRPSVNEEWITYASDGRRVLLETIKTPMTGPDGRIVGVLGIARDITERKLTENELSLALRKMHDIIEFLPDPTFVIDRDHRIVAWNKAMEQLSGVAKSEMLGQGDYAYALPFYGERRPILIDLAFEDTEALKAKYDYVKQVDNAIYAETFIDKWHRETGAYLWGAAAPLFDSSGARIGAIEVIRDITEKKNVERDLRESNREKELLLREMQHRIGNTLTIISGFLSLEKGKIDDEASRSAFQEAINRIRTISEIYGSLHQSSAMNSVSLSQYIRTMARRLLDSYSPDPGNIELSLRLDDVALDMKRAMNIGLIVNELLTNSIKYAFPDNARGTIRIELDSSAESLVLVVSDDGKGLGAEVREGKGIGLGIARLLAEELGGSFEIEGTKGTTARLRMPSRDY